MSQYKTVYLPTVYDSRRVTEGVREIISLVNGQASQLKGGEGKKCTEKLTSLN